MTSWHTKLNDLTKPMGGNIITGKQAVVVESYLSSDEKTWYRVWSDGWKECGFYNINRGASSEATVTLPVTYSNVFYTISFCQDWGTTNVSGYGNVGNVIIGNKTTSSFLLRNGISPNATFTDLYICGY